MAESMQGTINAAVASGSPGRLADRVPLRILVVDDIEVNRRVAIALLRRLGYEPDAAASGLEAIDAAMTGAYDLVLLDVQMPDPDGPAVARALREQLGPRTPRIIAVTAQPLEGDRKRFLATGMDDYVTKPIDLPLLRAAIERTAPAVVAPSSPAGEAPLVDWRRLDLIAPYGDAALGGILIEIFTASAREQAAALRIASLAGHAPGQAAAAHALRGAAANVGAAAIDALASEIEMLANGGNPAAAATCASAMDACIERTVAALANRTGAAT